MLSHSIRTAYHALPPTPRFLLRRLVYAPVDIYESIARKRHALVEGEPLPESEEIIGLGVRAESEAIGV